MARAIGRVSNEAFQYLQMSAKSLEDFIGLEGSAIMDEIAIDGNFEAYYPIERHRRSSRAGGRATGINFWQKNVTTESCRPFLGVKQGNVSRKAAKAQRK